MKTLQDKYFKELAEIYADYEDKEMGERAIFQGLQRTYVMGKADGRIMEVEKRLRKIKRELNLTSKLDSVK